MLLLAAPHRSDGFQQQRSGLRACNPATVIQTIKVLSSIKKLTSLFLLFMASCPYYFLKIYKDYVPDRE